MSWEMAKTAKLLLQQVTMTMMMKTTALKSLVKMVDEDAETAHQDRQDVSTKSCFSLHDVDVDNGDLYH